MRKRDAGSRTITSLVPAATIALLVVLSPLIPTPSAHSLRAQEGRRDASVGAAIVGGLLGGGMGFAGGAYLGSTGDCYELCTDIFFGALIGETLGVALGAHLFNGARGNLLADVGTSAGIMAVGVGLASMDSGDELILAAMIGQVIGVALTEARTSPWIEPTTALSRTPEGLALHVGLRSR